MPDLRNLTKDAGSELSPLKTLLQRVPAWKNNEEREELLRLHLQMKEVRQKVSQSLKEFEGLQTEEQLRVSQLQRDLAAYVEALKNASMSFFSQGQYQECYEVLMLLVEIEPHNQAAIDFLEITRGKILEGQDRYSSGADEALSTSPSEMGNAVASQEISQSIPEHLSDSPKPGENTTKWSSGRRWPGVIITGLGLFLAGILARVWTQVKSEPASAAVEIQSEPDSADVFMNGLLVGKTQLQLNSVAAGSYALRLEREGYAPAVHQLVIEKGQSSLISFRLEKLGTEPSSPVSLREKAQALFDLGNLAEAGLICNTILEHDPQDSFAIKLKENIHNYYFAPMVHEESNSGLKAQPLDVSPAALSSAKLIRPQSTPPPELPKELLQKSGQFVGPASSPPKAEFPELAQAAKPIGLPGTLGSSERTLGPVKPIGGPVASSSPAAPKPNSADQDVIIQVQAKIQAKEFDQARNLLSQIQNVPSTQVDWKSLTDKLKAEEARQQNLALPWIQKAESALISGRYITPPDDNVLLYCNRALAIDPQDQKVLALKKDVIGRSVTQARDWIDRGKFDEARLFYSSLNYLSQNDGRFPISRQELQRELTKLEFSSYPVIHQHKLGSCKGRLRMNGYVVSFAPSGDSVDGFTEKLMNVNLLDAGDDLKLKVKDKSYRFLLNAGPEKEATQKAARPMYEQLIKLLSPKG